MYRNILVAVDGSAGSQRALCEAAGLVTEGVTLRVLMVAENPRWSMPLQQGTLYDAELMRKALLEHCQEVLDKVRQDMVNRGVAVQVRLVDLSRERGNSVPQAILREAAEWPADLLVMGTHGRQGFRRMVMGSVAEHIARMSPQPVLLVRESGAPCSDVLTGEFRDYSGRLFSDWPEAEYMG